MELSGVQTAQCFRANRAQYFTCQALRAGAPLLAAGPRPQGHISRSRKSSVQVKASACKVTGSNSPFPRPPTPPWWCKPPPICKIGHQSPHCRWSMAPVCSQIQIGRIIPAVSTASARPSIIPSTSCKAPRIWLRPSGWTSAARSPPPAIRSPPRMSSARTASASTACGCGPSRSAVVASRASPRYCFNRKNKFPLGGALVTLLLTMAPR